MKYLQIIVRLDDADVARNSDLMLYQKTEGGEFEYDQFLFGVDNTVTITPAGTESDKLPWNEIRGEVIFLETHSDEQGQLIYNDTQTRLAR